jgi:hypothetical protein
VSTDAQITALIDGAFGGSAKPEHFTNFSHCVECLKHDELLRARDVTTLRIEDVGNICWQPISFTSPEGLAYYFPALARLALAEPTYGYGWYGDTLHIHLSSSGPDDAFLKFCSPKQRQAVAALLQHLDITRAHLDERSTTHEEFESAWQRWRSD